MPCLHVLKHKQCGKTEEAEQHEELHPLHGYSRGMDVASGGELEACGGRRPAASKDAVAG